MSDVKNTKTLNDTDRSSQRMQSHHSHQANQTTHIAQTERENNIFSQDVKERVNMARQGENLDVLVHDSCPMVRREVAMRGYGLDVLLNDEASIVRQAVASTGFYDLSSFKNDTSSIVRNASEVGHNAMKEALSIHNHKIDNIEAKTTKIQAEISKVNSELNKLNTAKSTHRVRMYAEYDSATNSNRVHLKLDTTRMSAAELAQHKRDNRGLLHKIDSTFKSENVGLVYAKLQKPLTYGEDGKRHLQSPVTFHSLSIRPPKLLRKAGNALWQQALKEEAGLFRYGDTAKRLLVDPASQAAKLAVLNKLNEAGRDNLAVDIAVKGTRTTLAATRVLMDYRKDMLAYKPTQLQNKRDRLANKQARLAERLDKAEMKAEIAGHKAIFNAANDRAKNKFGLNPSVKKDKDFVKNSWVYIHGKDVKGKDYIAAPPKQRLDKNSMSKAEYKHQKKLNKLEKKEFKANKKAYETVSMKQAYFNQATGQVKTRTVTMVDKTRPKKPKAKKPSSLGGRAALAGLGELRYKAFNAMAQDDNAAVSAAGKGANAAFSEFSKAHTASLQRREKLREKRLEKARMKAEKSSAKLQAEKSKSNFSDKKKNNKKKSQKKRLKKNRNAELFKQNMQKAAKKARDEIARKAADFIAGKGKFVALGALGVVIAMIIPMMFLFMLGGGGGGMLDNTAIIGVATYTTDRATLIELNTEYQNLVWEWQQEFNTKVDEQTGEDTAEWELILSACFPVHTSGCPNAAEAMGRAAAEHAAAVANGTCPPGNVYKVIKNLGAPNTIVPTCDMRYIYAYYTVKYKDEPWPSIEDEFGDFFKNYYEFKEVSPPLADYHNSNQLIDVHTHESCAIKDGKHSHSSEEEEHYEEVTKKIIYYRFQPKNGDDPYTIEEYILDQIKNIGEKDKDGVSEGQKHYEMLLESLGLTQVVSYPVYYPSTGEPMDWSEDDEVSFFGEIAEFIDINTLIPEEQRDPNALEDYRFLQLGPVDTNLTLPWVMETIEIVAGGEGVITEKTDTSVTIHYEEDNLSVRYEGVARTDVAETSPQISGMTTLEVGDKVEEGTHLFYNEPFFIENWGDVKASLRLTTYDTEVGEYINPFYVVQSRIH